MNGFNLGRYWETEGPQHTLYIPGPRLNNVSKNGARQENSLMPRQSVKTRYEELFGLFSFVSAELVVLELHNASASKNFTLQGGSSPSPLFSDCRDM